MHSIIIQLIAKHSFVPTKTLLRKWAKAALNKRNEPVEVTIRIVDAEEMSTLNSTYRQKKGPTNVLSFPFEMPDGIDVNVSILGDIVICAEVVNKEARAQGKIREAHWAHMIIHGIFHLLGYDHVKESDAAIMEALETTLLARLGFDDPYQMEKRVNQYD